jgi:dihydrofolate synthase/folylpolyglutamate synthase
MPTDPFDYPAAIEYLYGLINYEKTADSKPYPFRLRRMRQLLEILELQGVAGDDLPVVHIAGTKGKGSTATMVAAMLSASGVRTGLYTSPHLIELEERFVVDGQRASKPEVASLIAAVGQAADHLTTTDAGQPTFFELITAVALLHFKKKACQAVVLEVGLGGRLDSTNVCSPTVTAITSIGMDHQHILGNSLGEIAFQKAGIIKPDVPVVSGVVDREPADVIEQVAVQRGAPLLRCGTDFDFKVAAKLDAWGSRFDLASKHPAINDRVDWHLPLDGAHQGRNAALACVILDLLQQSGTNTSTDHQRIGLAEMKCAGRIERFLLADGGEVILDTAHNVDSINALCNCLEQRAAGRTVTVIFGTSRDKDHVPMLNRLCETADRLVLTRYHGNPRYREPDELLAALPPDRSATIRPCPVTALAFARQTAMPPEENLIVVCGSFFLAAEVRPLLVRL